MVRVGPLLVCPECRMSTTDRGNCRIGNARSMCATCNSFAQATLRHAGKIFRERYKREYLEIREKVELELYRGVVHDWTKATQPKSPEDDQ